MTRHNPQKFLFDIQSCCEFLLKFTSNRTVSDYIADRAFRSAIERELQIIGEAMLQLDNRFPEVAECISDHRSIIGFRHVLVHGYDSLNPKTVWNVVETKLEPLLSQVSSLI